MTRLFPLTTAGVQELINELYAMPDPELQLEADAIGANFRMWVKSHFELSATQIQYLDQIDERWITNAATESKYFFENRLPIALIKDVLSRIDGADEDRGKLLDLDKKSNSSYSQEGGYEENETLSYTISYPSL